MSLLRYFENLECYLHLSLDAVVVVAHQVTAEAVCVLQLQTALGVEPVLHAASKICLLPTALRRIAVVIVGRCDNIKTLTQGYRTCEIGTTTAYFAILTGEELTAQTDAATCRLASQHSGNFCLATKADAVATVVVTNSYVRVPCTGVDSMSARDGILISE